MAYLIAGIAFCSTLASEAESTQNDDLWRLVAQAHTIVGGRLIVPVAEIQAAAAAGEGRYVNITVGTTRVLKRPTQSASVSIQWWTEPNSNGPTVGTIENLDGQEAILFLTQFDEAGPGHFFLRTPKALQASSPEAWAAIEAEVSAQEAILKNYQPPAIKDTEFRRVRKLVDSLTHPERAEEALSELQSLGKESVPAMIHLMDDRRSLTVKQITVSMPAGHWEGIAHYAPQCVVDVMSILLSRITGESFGTLQNGGSERERAAAVDAWRVYLHYLTIESETALDGRP
ncbi:MAG: hypothetical protein JNK74_22885 [Candidatus Hydrogenedentes bacterium]|nr:hypothetical protein [Candidatus Hydrogenedentota bacterium]